VLVGIRLQVVPARLFGHPEDVVGDIEVAVIDEVSFFRIGERLDAALFETVRDVLQKDKAECDVLVFGGVHIAAQFVGGSP
jgi:hypothetical protein